MAKSPMFDRVEIEGRDVTELVTVYFKRDVELIGTTPDGYAIYAPGASVLCIDRRASA